MIVKQIGPLLMSCSLCLTCYQSLAQSQKSAQLNRRDSILHKVVYTAVDTPPTVEGGIEKLFAYISKNLKYPAGQTEYIGKVAVAFVVEPDGSIDGERTVLDPNGHGGAIIKQIFDLVHQLKWKPGSLNGKRVPVLYSLPIFIDIAE